LFLKSQLKKCEKNVFFLLKATKYCVNIY